MKKAAHIIFSVGFLAIIFGICIGSVLRERDRVSYYENRVLAYFPAFNSEDFWSGQYFTDVDTAVDDHILYRDRFMKTATRIDIMLGRPVVSGMVMPENLEGPLVNFYGYPNWDNSWKPAMAEEMGRRLEEMQDIVTSYGGYFVYVGVPQQDTYYIDAYPDFMDNRESYGENSLEVFSAALAQRNIPFVDMLDIFRKNQSDVNYFYETDHHYNYHGAVATYRALLERVNEDTGLGITILQDEDLDYHTLPNPYLGSRNRRIYGLANTQEKIEYATPIQAIEFSRWDTGFDAKGQIYALPEHDTDEIAFTTYMGNDIAQTVIGTNRPELPNCLIFGDSFTNPVETLLWTGFNETRSLDLRHYNEYSILDYIAEWQPDVVICLRDEGTYFNLEGNGNFE